MVASWFVLMLFVVSVQQGYGQPDEVCRDKVDNCFAHISLCNKPDEYVFSRYYCQRTCGYCSLSYSRLNRRRLCIDQVEFCKRYESWCTTPGYLQFQEYYCTKTCAKCYVVQLDPFESIKTQLSHKETFKSSLGDKNPVRSMGNCTALNMQLTEASRRLFSAGMYKFAWNLFQNAQRNLRQNLRRNFVVSPIAAASMLHLIYRGAQGNLRTELSQSDLFINLYPDEAQKIYSSVAKYFTDFSLRLLDRETELHFANILLFDDDHRIRFEFRDATVGCLDVMVFMQNFNAHPAKNAEKIHRAVHGALQNKPANFPRAIDLIEPHLPLLFASGMYFKGKFGESEGYGFERKFFLTETHAVPLPMAFLDGKFGLYYEPFLDTDVLAIESPHSMQTLFLLQPKKVGSFWGIDRWLDGRYLLQLMNNVDYSRKFSLLMPSFKVAHWFDLITLSSKLGLPALQQQIDSSEMFLGTNLPNKFSHLFHLSAAEISGNWEQGMEHPRTDFDIVHKYTDVFIVDRPFMFVVRDNPTNTILFLGRITDPTKPIV